MKCPVLQTSATPPVVHQSHSHRKSTFISIHDIGDMRNIYKIFQCSSAPGHWWTGWFSLWGWEAIADIALGAFFCFCFQRALGSDFKASREAKALLPPCRVWDCLKIENVILHVQRYTNVTQPNLHGCEEPAVFVAGCKIMMPRL